MKRLIVILLSLVFCFGVFAGGTACFREPLGDTEYEDDFDPDKEYSISFFGWGDLEEQDNFQRLIDKFMEKYPNVFVLYTSDSSATFMNTLTSMDHQLPDVFYMPDTEFLQWADSGKLMNISSAVRAEDIATVWPESVNKYYYNKDTYMLGKSEGAGLYGLPKDLGPFTLVYNKTLLNAQIEKYSLNSSEIYAKLSPDNPMSWAEFRALLKQLDPVGNASRETTDPYGISHYEIEAAVYSNNADFFDETTTQSRISEKNFTDAIQFISDLCLVDEVMPTAANQASTNGYQRFKNRNAIFSFMGPWDNANFWKTTSFDYDIIPVPYGTAQGAESVAWVGSMCYSVAYNTQSPGAAIRLAKFLSMEEDAQREFYELGQSVPNIMSMAKGEYLSNSEGLLTGRKANPANRSVFIDMIDGNKNANDKVRGKDRARYYTYGAIWYDDFLDMLNEKNVWTQKNTAATAINAYNENFQAKLTQMVNEYRF